MNRGRFERRSRRGLAMVLSTIVLVLLLASILTFARKIHSSRVASTAQVAATGTVALTVLESALEEARVELGRRANEPGDELYDFLRAEGLPAERTARIATPATVRLLASDPLTSGLVLQDGCVTASFLARERTGLEAYEHRGLVRLEAVVRHRPLRVTRRLVRDVTLRVQLLTVPRPFDQFTWAILDPQPLLDPQANARIDGALAWMKSVREEIAPAVQKQLRDWLTAINRGLQQAGTVTGAAVEPFDVEAYAGRFDRERFLEAPVYTWNLKDRHHYFLDKLVLFGRQREVPDLAQLHLKPRADQLCARVEEARTACSAARKAYEEQLARVVEKGRAGLGSGQQGVELVTAFRRWLETADALARAMVAVSDVHGQLLALYTSYTDLCGELGGAPREELLGKAANLGEGPLKDRASHRFSGPTAVADAVRFLKSHMRPGAGDGRRLDATVHVDNGSVPLTLDDLRGADGTVTIRGRVVLSTSGPVRLADVRLADRASDLFVVSSGGPLTVSGGVQAALVARAGLVSNAGARLEGELVIAGPQDPAQLAGRLVNGDNRYFSGVSGSFKGPYTQASLAPWAVRSSLRRE